MLTIAGEHCDEYCARSISSRAKDVTPHESTQQVTAHHSNLLIYAIALRGGAPPKRKSDKRVCEHGARASRLNEKENPRNFIASVSQNVK